MKKNLFILALCAISTCFFAGCKGPENGKDEPGTDIKIELSQTTLSLSVGSSSERLIAKVTPAGTNVTVVWSSDNEAVATVRSGVVQGVAEGTANITAAVGDVKAVCVVTVSNDAIIDNYVISGWGIFGSPQMIDGTERYVHFTSGDSAKCQLGLTSLAFWDNNLTYTDGAGFSGTGIMGSADLPVYWITEGENAGFYVGSTDGFWIDTISGSYAAYTAKAGALVDEQKYVEFFRQLSAYQKDTTAKPNTKLYTEAFEGSQLYILYANDKRESYSVGNVLQANLVEEDNQKLYAAKIEWLDFFSADRFFGLKVTYDDQKDFSVVEPYDLRRIVKAYTNAEASEVRAAEPQYVIGNPKRIHLNDKVAEKQLSTLNLYKK